MSPVYIALIHYPVYDKNKKVVTTSISSINIHDISRVAKTYGIKAFYIVTPLIKQQELIQRIIEHWISGYGAKYNETRKEAFDVIRVESDIEEAVRDIKKNNEEKKIIRVVTSACNDAKLITYKNLTSIIKEASQAVLIIFGTGWGVDDSIKEGADFCLEPIVGVGDYNHLSVRSAVAITLDRLIMDIM
ncbi:MAG: RNA methyltransferase [bacterium]